jgi:hypothetical protein
MIEMAGLDVNLQRRSLALAALAAPLWAAASLRAPAAGTEFPVFDALLQRGKPNLSHQGLVRMFWVADIWRPGEPKELVDERGIGAVLEQLPAEADTLYIDVESWPLLGVTDSIRLQSVDNYIRTAEIIRRSRRHFKIGFYGVAPACVYWPIVRQDRRQLADWRAANRALRPLGEWVDFVLPSLYTFYDDHSGWRQFATATLDEAHQYGKPIYPFLWFEYFDGNPLLRGKQLRTVDWRDELELCRQYADGVVLWGGSERNWSESADWWQVVLQFMRGTTTSSTGPAGR